MLGVSVGGDVPSEESPTRSLIERRARLPRLPDRCSRVRALPDPPERDELKVRKIINKAVNPPTPPDAAAGDYARS